MHRRVLDGVLPGLGLLLAATAVPASAQEDIDPAIERLIAAGQVPRAALAEANRQQADGDLIGAAATLERALIESPGADAVRIEYVTVLCRLDDRGAARLELDLLQGRIVGSEPWNRMVAACGDDFANTRRRTSEISARIAAGFAFDQNAAEQLTSFEVFGNGSRSGLAFVGSAQIDARIGAGAGFVYGNALALTHNGLSGADNEYQFGQAALGYGKEFASAGISAGAVIRNGRLFGANHVTAYGGQVRAARQLGSSAQIVAAAEVVHEDYADDTFDGTHYDLMAGYDLTTASLQRYFVGIGAERKTTAVNFADFTGYRLAGSLELPLGWRGTTLNGSVTLRRIVFDQDPGSDRIKQWRLFARLAAQIPVVGQSLFVEPAVTYRRRDYSGANFLTGYSSAGGELRLVWKL
jgi:hypothetical protein